MIKYKLICRDCESIFDSWFSLSKEYERLKKKKLLNCHVCNSLNVEKTLMSPSVFKSKNNLKINQQTQKYKEAKNVILKYQEFVKKNSDELLGGVKKVNKTEVKDAINLDFESFIKSRSSVRFFSKEQVSIKKIQNVGAKINGIIINDLDTSKDSYYSYYYSYSPDYYTKS